MNDAAKEPGDSGETFGGDPSSTDRGATEATEQGNLSAALLTRDSELRAVASQRERASHFMLGRSPSRGDSNPDPFGLDQSYPSL